MVMKPFGYRGNHLLCETAELGSIARRFGTPCFVESENAILDSIERFRRAFSSFSPLICYAVKANSSAAILRLAARADCGAEVVSGGELYRALRAGIPPGRIVFSGVGKTGAEIAEAARRKVLFLEVDSAEELRTVDAIGRRMGRRIPVVLRINPDVDAHTHRYITTGTNENKFGIDIACAEPAFALAARLRGVRLAGVHTHLGSQIVSPEPFVLAAKRINGLIDRLARRGIALEYRVIGGGFGIPYLPGSKGMDLEVLARRLGSHIRHGGLNLVIEPGRYIVGAAGVLLTKVLYVKKGVKKTFVVVDAGMNDLIRPCLYQAYHEILPCERRRGRGLMVDVVGPVCESSDFLALGRRLSPVAAGDCLAVMCAGAYGLAMSSNYNSRPRAAEVMVRGRRARLVRRRERYADLVRGESF